MVVVVVVEQQREWVFQEGGGLGVGVPVLQVASGLAVVVRT